MREHFALDAVKHVALILVAVDPLVQFAVDGIRVVAGGDEVGSKFLAEGPKLPEFQPVVAHTRMGSACAPRAYSSAK